MMTTADRDKFYQQLGELIKEARNNAGLKQEALANLLQLSRASVVNMEKGRQHPSIYQLGIIASILGIALIELLPKFAESHSKSTLEEMIDMQIGDNQESKEKLMGFIEEVKSSKQNNHAK